jgi:hypothetical protein
MIKLKIGSRILNKDGQITTMDADPFLKNSRTFVPLRFIAEAFGKVVEWNNDTQEVTVYDRKKYFETADACAYDWAMYWNAMSIALFKEMGAIIYKSDDGYYWDNIMLGKDKGVIWDFPKVRKGVAFIHSHGGGEHWNTKSMSREDFDMAKDCNRPLYMVDSGGCLWVYDPLEDKPKQTLVREGAPKDARWMDIKASAELQSEYFSVGYHSLDEYEHGYKADYYNKLHMKGLNYLKEGAVT